MMRTTSVKIALSAVVFSLLTFGLAPQSGFAASTTATFAVSATVPATCTVSASALTFGSYVATAVSNSTSTVSVTCTNTTTYNVGLNPGATTGATVSTRQMLNGTQVLNYGLYKDSGHTSNWGQTVGTDTATGTGNGGAQAFTVYGQIPAGQYPTPGSYADTVTATVTY